MAQAGFTPIKLYYSATPSSTPTAGNLAAGELAINTFDGKLFYKDSSNAVQVIATKASAALVGSTSDVISRGTSYGISAGNVSTGTGNTYIGYSAGATSTTGGSNTAVGDNALVNITTGSYNVAIGSVCLSSVSTGSGNIGIGSGCLINNNGNDNTAVGTDALPSSTGNQITAVGSLALNKLTTGARCTSVGFSAGTRVNTGSDNLMVGHQAGDFVNTGSQNTIIGSSAASSGTNDLTTGSNNTIIGYNAAASANNVSNEITLGNSSVTSLRVPGVGFQFDTTDGLVVPKTITAAGTTGAQTINKTAGSVNFAAAATSLVVTNSFVDANSVIICTVATNDATMTSVQAVAGSGSFTLYANAAATAETRVNFLVVN